MKSYRLVLVFCVLAVALLACTWVLGFINENQMFDFSGRVLGVIVILGVCLGLTYTLLRGEPSPQNEPNSKEPGPKF
jgi:hypothetical protein